MSEDPKLVKLPSQADRKIAELQQQLQQLGHRLLQTSPEAQNIIGQLSAWQEIAKSQVDVDDPGGGKG